MKRTELSRRGFLGAVVIVLNALTAALLIIPTIGYVLSPLLRRRTPRWVSLGSASELSGDTPRGVRYTYRNDSDFMERDVRRTAFVLRLDGEWIALSGNCTHMGCNVAYNAEAGTFDCPCHGGRYDRAGLVIEGPPPRALKRFRTRVVDGALEIEVV